MLNKVTLIGNVGMDPEIRTIESGAKVARIRLATTERIFNRQTNETKEHTEWHTIIMWRGLADIADKYIRKGSQIYVEGNLRSREWTDKENVKHFVTEIVAYEMKLLGRRNDAQPQTNQSVNQSQNTNVSPSISTPAPAVPEDDIDDLPF